jgi:hypothetical protein
MYWDLKSMYNEQGTDFEGQATKNWPHTCDVL